MKKKKTFCIAGLGGLLTAVLILSVRFADVAPIGPDGTCIGLSHLNQAVFDLFGVHMLWYEITDWLGIAAILTGLLFAGTGFLQLIRRKSILKVDRELLLLACLYMTIAGLYVLFELVIVNYRPIIMPDGTGPEASFPSSHTMLVCVIMGSTIMLLDKYVKGKALCRVLRGICGAVMGIAVVGRLISGVHWFTDIIGSILISTTLLALFFGIKEGIESRQG